MKKMIAAFVLFPFVCLGQSGSANEGIYTIRENPDVKVRLKVNDTIRQAYTFTADSFRYSYAVMRPNTNKIVSVDYVEYGTWSPGDEVIIEVTDTTGKKATFSRQYAVVGDTPIGYFAPAWAALDDFTGRANQLPAFVKGKKVFIKSGTARQPLLK